MKTSRIGHQLISHADIKTVPEIFIARVDSFLFLNALVMLLPDLTAGKVFRLNHD
jgi:hypothetical protein